MSVICKKKKCFSCKTIKSIHLKCKWCSNEYCTNCIQQEYHNCEKLDLLINNINSNLKKELENQQCVGNKIIKI